MGKTFGKLATGAEARLYTISCGRIRANITNYGASLVALFVDGLDVVLGCDDVSDVAIESLNESNCCVACSFATLSTIN